MRISGVMKKLSMSEVVSPLANKEKWPGRLSTTTPCRADGLVAFGAAIGRHPLKLVKEADAAGMDPKDWR